jgi:predicted permease
VIGHRLWLERFESDGGVLGRTIRVDGQEHVIIAVMPPDFRFPAPYWAAGDLWLLRPPAHRSWPDTRGRVMLAFGLLRDGRTIARAQAEADAVAAALDARYPDAKRRIGLRLTTWAEAVRAEAQPRLLLVLGGAVMVFLIVCANVANLLISRGVDRQRELAARVALGAGRPRLIRQVLTETGVLFAIGGGVGVLAAIWGSRLIASMQGIPRMDEATIDAPVAASAMATTLVAAAIVGLVPALQAARAGASDLAAFGSRSVSHPKRWRRVQRALVAAEIGLALVLLSGAGALLEGAREQARVDPGFEVDGLLQARIALPPDKYASPGAQVAFYSRVIDVLRGAPDVVAAGLVDVPPGVGGRGGPSVLVDGDPAPASVRDLRRADVRVVSAGYLETLGLAPRFGRFFSSADSPAVPVAIVNEAFVRQHLDDRAAVGRSIRVAIGGIDGLDRTPRAIVGVVPDLREKTLYEPAPPTVYVPLTQAESTRTALLRMAILVRSTRPTADLVTLVRAAIAEVDPDQAAFGFMTMRDRMEEELSLNRLNLALLGVLSTVSLFLAVVGVYGVTAHAVRQRTREIGIRLALGETPGGVQRLLLGESSALLVGGFAVGGIAAVFGTALLRSLVFGIDETSAGTFVGAGIVLAAAVLAGGLVPMRRAARVDPASVLRWE